MLIFKIERVPTAVGTRVEFNLHPRCRAESLHVTAGPPAGDNTTRPTRPEGPTRRRTRDSAGQPPAPAHMEGAKPAETAEAHVKTGQLIRTYTAEARPPGVKRDGTLRQTDQPGKAGSKQAGKNGNGGSGGGAKQRLRQLKSALEEGLIDEGSYQVAQRALVAELAGVSFRTTCTVTHTDGSTVTTTATTARGGHKWQWQGQRALGPRGPIGPNTELSAPPHDMAAVIGRLGSGRPDIKVRRCIEHTMQGDSMLPVPPVHAAKLSNPSRARLLTVTHAGAAAGTSRCTTGRWWTTASSGFSRPTTAARSA